MSSITPNQREIIAIQDEITGDPFYVGGIEADKSINVNITSSSITSDINLTKVGGTSISLGQTTMSASLPVTIASNQSSLTTETTSISDLDLGVGTIDWESRGGVLAGFGSTTVMADMAAYGDDATQNILATGIRLYSAVDGQYKRLRGSSDGLFIQGSAATNTAVTAQPILIGGSDYAGTPSIQNWKIDSSGVGQVNVTNTSIAITASTLPLPLGASTSANQTNGSQLTQIVDAGGDAATVTGSKLDVNAAISGSISNTSFEATQATAANLNATIVGTGTFATQLTANPLVSSPLVGQAIIAVSGTAVRLNGGTSQPLTNGIIISAPAGNVAPISVGASSVNDTADGTGNGYLLAPGASVSFAVNNTNVVYINGQAGDYISWAGS